MCDPTKNVLDFKNSDIISAKGENVKTEEKILNIYHDPTEASPLQQYPNISSEFIKEIPLEQPTLDWRATTRSIKSKLSYALTHDVYQDVTFIVGPEKECVRAHKFIILLASSAFEHMSDISDEKKGIQIPDVDANAFKSVLKFIYTDKFEVTPESAMHSLYIAKKFVIPALAERCVELLRTNIGPNNVVTIFQGAMVLNEHELSSSALGFLIRNAKIVVNSEEFLDLSYDNLCLILERDELDVDELSLYQATVRWAEEKCRRDQLDATPEDLRYELKRCLSLIRFPLLTSEEFTVHVVPRGILSMAEMLELYKYFSLSPAKRSSLPPMTFGTKRRSATPKIPIYTMERLQGNGIGPWNNNVKRWTIRFMVDRRIQIRGYGFYGSFELDNPKYHVGIFLESRMYPIKAQATEMIQLHQKGGVFQVNFNELVDVQPNVWYEAGFTLKGPNTTCGARHLGQVSMSCGDKGTITFQFEDASTTGSTDNQLCYQLPQLYFTL